MGAGCNNVFTNATVIKSSITHLDLVLCLSSLVASDQMSEMVRQSRQVER